MEDRNYDPLTKTWKRSDRSYAIPTDHLTPPVVGKTFERVTYGPLIELLENYEIIPETQAGFRTSRSTQDQLFKITQAITTGFQEGEVTLTAMYDTHKSFDKIWHDGLIMKISNFLNEPAVAFIQSFLTNRNIRIRINGKFSEKVFSAPKSIICGVPQPGKKADMLSQFADDLAIWTTRKNTKEAKRHLQIYNDRISRLCKVWRVKLSTHETQITLFHRNRIKTRPTITVEGNQIRAGKSCEFLGLTLDHKLTMKQQVTKISKELQNRVAILAKIAGSYQKPRADTGLSLQIFKSMIVPFATYTPSALVLAKETQLKKIDTILRKGARIAIHCPQEMTTFTQ